MSRLLQTLLGVAVFPLAYVSAVSLIGLFSGSPAVMARSLAQTVICGALAAGCLRWARRRAASDGSLSGLTALDSLYSFYTANGLRSRVASVPRDDNPYLPLSDAQLEDVLRSISSAAPRDRLDALLAVTKQRVEAAFLADGRPLPREVRGRVPTPAAPGTACQRHPERPAVSTCARCGAFCCRGCSEGRSHCHLCVEKLMAPAG